MFWIIAGAVVVTLTALAWWTSGRAKPDLRRRSVRQSVEIAEGRAEGYRSHGGLDGHSPLGPS